MKINKHNGVFILPDADHVEGATLHKAADWRLSTVDIQFRNASAGWCQTTMTVPNALYLLNLLEAMMVEQGYDQYRRPPAA